ncbi:MAG TPA: polysaccharide biosynthesis protein [Bacteroidota bacterium]|nr:polysaccharide biosynthesis protein [Bacteroidota bacterium]
MEIQDRTVLVLGGWGLVGSAVCRSLMEEHPKKIILTSLKEAEAREAVEQMTKEFPRAGKNFFQPWWGNIFTRQELKDMNREDILSDPVLRAKYIDDIVDEMSEPVLHRSALHQLITHYKPDVVIDCINSATAIAYQNVFQSAREVLQQLRENKPAGNDTLRDSVERLLCTLYIPQLIRHVQIFYRSMNEAGTKIYVKIGTSGTGGMGLNIPYTHSEEKPSSVLLSKSAVAGAQTLLLFLMGRTPDAPITKEIKPTGAIAWKKIGFGPIAKRGKPIELVDCPPRKGIRLDGAFAIKMDMPAPSKRQPLKSVFIDTGENGIFSRGEFEAISTPGQMEYVTPEEIATDVIYEIKGGNTGHDIINALDNATLEPTYRAGFMFNSALEKMKALEREHKVDSVAFEMLGPPRLSKLLYETYLLKVCFATMKTVVSTSAKELSKALASLIDENQTLRSQIISIGIPILLPDGKTLLRGSEIKIPPFRGENILKITDKSVDEWATSGWVDLRVGNMEKWKSRFTEAIKNADKLSHTETSSRYLRNLEYWKNFDEIDPGKIVGWIFTEEEKGERMKA